MIREEDGVGCVLWMQRDQVRGNVRLCHAKKGLY